jgi:hypothetical protein
MALELDGFLDGEDAGTLVSDAPVAPATGAPEAPVVEPREPKPAPAAADPVVKDDEDHAVPDDVAGLRAAVVAERAKRKDYKGERDRLAGENAAIKAELEASRRAPVAAAPPAPPPEPQAVHVPSPLEDPAGYHAFVQRALFNERLNNSEAMLRGQLNNDADIDAKLAVFKKAADANPALRSELTRQPNPYRWAYQQAQRIMAMDEIGTDPAAYRTKVEAEIEARVRAAVEAEYAAAAPAGAPVRVHLPQSLGTARSAGARNTPVINVAENFDDILAPVRRK